MLKNFILIIALLFASAPAIETPAHGFGLRKVLRAPFKARRIVPRRVVRVPARTLRRALGGVVVASAGVVILSGLTPRQRKEVRRRTDDAVESNPDEEFIDEYETTKGGKSIKITASPSQPPASWRDDPALNVAVAPSTDTEAVEKKTADAGKISGPQFAEGSGISDATPEPNVNTDAKTTKKVAEGEEADGVKLADLPADTLCRKVTTELTIPAKKKDPEKTETNAAVLCKTADGKWQPAVL